MSEEKQLQRKEAGATTPVASGLLELGAKGTMSPMRSSRIDDRVALIDRLLRGQERVTLARLTRELGVTERTVCRDLEFMKERLGLPVQHSAARGYHYARPVPLLVAREAVAGPISRSKPPTRDGRLRRLLETIHEALYAQHEIWIETMEGPGPLKPFVLQPFFLSRVLGDLLLFGCRPEDGRLFNLSLRLLEDVRPTGNRFEASLAEGPKVRESEGWGGKGEASEVELFFPPEAHWASSLFFAQNQTGEQTTDGHTVRFRTGDLERVRDLACVLGDRVRVAVRSGEPA